MLTLLLIKKLNSDAPAFPEPATQLHTFCLWYHDFYEKNEANADWKSHFAEESLSNFENDRFRSALATSNTTDGLLEKDLEDVCEEIDVTIRTRLQLAKLGIVSVGALLAKKVDLELFALDDIKKTVQKSLLKFCLWHEYYYRIHDADAALEEGFNDDEFATFEQEPSVERDYRKATERLHGHDGGVTNVSETIVQYTASITTRYMSKQLTQQCRGKFYPHDEVAATCFKALFHPSGKPGDIVYLVSGKTQSGKSTVKAVCAALHRQMSCLLIIITKGCAERDDLKIKLNRLLGGGGGAAKQWMLDCLSLQIMALKLGKLSKQS